MGQDVLDGLLVDTQVNESGVEFKVGKVQSLAGLGQPFICSRLPQKPCQVRNSCNKVMELPVRQRLRPPRMASIWDALALLVTT